MTPQEPLPASAPVPAGDTPNPQVRAGVRPGIGPPAEPPHGPGIGPARTDPPATRYPSRCKVCTLHHRPRCVGSKAYRWPFEPLLDAAGNISQRALMAKLNVSGTDLTAAEVDGLTDVQADRWATRLGWHPSMIWPGFDRAGLTPLDDVFVHQGWRQAWLAGKAAA